MSTQIYPLFFSFLIGTRCLQ